MTREQHLRFWKGFRKVFRVIPIAIRWVFNILFLTACSPGVIFVAILTPFFNYSNWLNNAEPEIRLSYFKKLFTTEKFILAISSIATYIITTIVLLLTYNNLGLSEDIVKVSFGLIIYSLFYTAYTSDNS